MKHLIFIFLLCAVPALANTYSTSFPLKETPISESGNWVNGKVLGVKWNNCNTNVGMAYGTQPGNTGVSDSACVLSSSTGSWGPNQSASITIKVNSNPSVQFAEAEVHINMTIAANSITGYEGNCSVETGQSYMQIVIWKGAFGSYSELNGVATTCASGDVLTLTRSGSQLTLTQARGGKIINTVTASDSTYTNGTPGMGFFIENLNSGASATTVNQQFGASTFSATDGQASAPSLSTISFANSSVIGPATDTGTVTLSGPATSATSISLSSNSTFVTVPTSVTVPIGASSASFTATAAQTATSVPVTITATYNGVSKTTSITDSPQVVAPATATISWTASTSATVSDPGYVNVYRANSSCSTSSITFTVLATNVIYAGPYTDSTVLQGNSYCYYLTEVLNGVESPASQTAEADIPSTTTQPAAPTNVNVVIN